MSADAARDAGGVDGAAGSASGGRGGGGVGVGVRDDGVCEKGLVPNTCLFSIALHTYVERIRVVFG
jgi:hypothetical protein